MQRLKEIGWWCVMKAETKKRQTGGWIEEGLSSLLEEERRVGWHKMDVSVVMSQG